MKKRKISLFSALVFILLLLPLKLYSAPLPETTAPGPGLIDLDIKDVDIKEFARIFSRLSGLNVIVSDDVKATVTFRGTKVEWEKALGMILKTYNLTYVREGNFLRILTYSGLRQEEEGVPLVTKVVFLNFSKAEDMSRALDTIKSSRGRITPDVKTSGLVITDTPEKIDKMLVIIKDLDKRTPQVMIEAMMVDVKLTAGEQLGIDWTATNKDISARSYTQLLAAGRTGLAGGVIQYGKTLLPHYKLTALIDFWCQKQKAEVLANPKILTLDGLPAKIELVEELPYKQTQVNASTGGTTTSYSFREAGIKLEVTPHISAGGFISLDLKTEQSYSTGTVDGQPVIDKRTAETNLLVADRETIVIGGLKKTNTTNTVDRIPVLGYIPFLGRLFQKRVDSSTNSELLIFVSPSIVTESRLSLEERKGLALIKPTYKEVVGVGAVGKASFPLKAPTNLKTK